MHPVIIQLLATEEGQRSTGVIDLREDAAFRDRHLRSSLHITGIEGLRHRFSWLPPPKSNSRGLVVIARLGDQEELKILLSRWNIVAYIGEYDEQFWSDAAKVDRLLVTEETKTTQIDIPAILFESSPILEPALQTVEKSQSNDTLRSLTILDLGMGAGRDLAWTVRRSSQFVWLASGIDNLLPAIERARLLRRDYRLEQEGGSRIESLVWGQASDDGSLHALQLANNSKSRGIPCKGQQSFTSLLKFAKTNLPHDTYDLIMLVRFYPRELIKRIVELTHDKSVIAISHFTTIHTEMDYVSPDSSKRFEESHLCDYLESWGQDWRIISHTIDRSEDGRPLRSVLFQRK